MKRAVVFSVMLLALAPFATEIAAEPQSIAACFFGFAQNERGERLRDVQVSVTSPNLSGTRQEYTDDSGQFCIHSLPPGPFTIFAEGHGFKTERHRNTTITVGLRFRVPLLLVLSPADNLATYKPERDRLLQSEVRISNCVCRDELQRLAETAQGNGVNKQ